MFRRRPWIAEPGETSDKEGAKRVERWNGSRVPVWKGIKGQSRRLMPCFSSGNGTYKLNSNRLFDASNAHKNALSPTGILVSCVQVAGNREIVP